MGLKLILGQYLKRTLASILLAYSFRLQDVLDIAWGREGEEEKPEIEGTIRLEKTISWKNILSVV